MATKLKLILVEMNVRQSWLAERTGINPTTLNMIVNGKAWPNLKTALKIARELHVSVEYLWSLDGEENDGERHS